MNDQRLDSLTDWLATHCDNIQSIVPLAGDASFRRYFRVICAAQNLIAMDAPKEDCRPFVCIAQNLRDIGVRAPTIYALDLEHGFLLLSDFGDRLLHSLLDEQHVDVWYRHCLDQLRLIQRHTQLPTYTLKAYNNALRSYYEECSWFMTWYLQQHCHYDLRYDELAELERELHLITKTMLEQPQVVVHRDYHSRNIMVMDDNTLGLLDFQDAVIGPITYDLASLLRDCYIDWPISRVHEWVQYHYTRLSKEGILTDCSLQQFLKWFDWTGLQRHLKCLGLFVRLNLRDAKPGYLQYIPRLIHYVQQATEPYPELQFLNKLIGMTHTRQCEVNT